MEISLSDSFSNSVYKVVVEDPFFIHKILSNLNGEHLLDPRKALENMHHKNINRLLYAKLNVNCLRNNFYSLQHIINKMIDVLMIFETKAHSCFLSAQFHLGDCASPYRLRRNPNGGNVL